MKENGDIFLSHTSALLCWSVIGTKGYLPNTDTDMRTPTTALHGIKALRQSPVMGHRFIQRLGTPLDLLVPSQNDKFKSGLVRCHVCINQLPAGGLRHLCEGAYLSSPASTLIQLAPSLTEAQLSLVGMQLCGTYYLTLEGLNANLNRSPLITPSDLIANITAYLHEPGTRIMRGTMKALNALVWVVERSNSPRESVLFLLLCLPTVRGGYGLPRPLLNPLISLSPRAQRIAGVEALHPDLCWISQRLIVEYNSHDRHHTDHAATSDDVRAEAFEVDGWTVVSVRTGRLNDVNQFDRLVRHTLTPRLQAYVPPLSSEFAQARAMLRKEILHFNPYDGVQAREAIKQRGATQGLSR